MMKNEKTLGAKGFPVASQELFSGAKQHVAQKRKRTFVNQLQSAIFIGPHLLFFAVFFIIPFVFGIVMSFFKWDMVGTPEFVGFDNFVKIFTFVGEAGDTYYNRLFFEGLRATVIYTVVATPLIIIVPMLFAVLLNSIKNGKLRSIFQAVLYAPSLLSVATVALIFLWLFNQDLGPVNEFFNTINVNWGVNKLYEAGIVTDAVPRAWIVIFIFTLWSGVGGNMIIFMSAMSNISPSLYEAANLDGANAWKKFWKITLPEMRFQLLYSTVMGTIGGFNVFGQTAMYGGDIYNTTLMQNIRSLIELNIAGVASAMALLLGLIISVFSAIQFKMMRSKD